MKVNVNIELARTYKNALTEMGKELSISGEQTLPFWPRFPMSWSGNRKVRIWRAVWTVLCPAHWKKPLCNVRQCGNRKGDTLLADFMARLEFFSKVVEQVAAAVPELLAAKEGNVAGTIGKAAWKCTA